MCVCVCEGREDGTVGEKVAKDGRMRESLSKLTLAFKAGLKVCHCKR